MLKTRCCGANAYGVRGWDTDFHYECNNCGEHAEICTVYERIKMLFFRPKMRRSEIIMEKMYNEKGDFMGAIPKNMTEKELNEYVNDLHEVILKRSNILYSAADDGIKSVLTELIKRNKLIK